MKTLTKVIIIDIILVIVLALLWTTNVFADIYVNADATGLGNGESPANGFPDFNKRADNSLIVAVDVDTIFVKAGGIYSDFSLNRSGIVFKRFGVGVNPIIKTTQVDGARYCVLLRGQNTTFIGVDIDGSNMEGQASHYGIRFESGGKGAHFIRCHLISPEGSLFIKHKSSRKQMGFEFISSGKRYKELVFEDTTFENEQDNQWLANIAVDDSTVEVSND